MTLSILRRLSAALLLTLTLSACVEDNHLCDAEPACNADQNVVERCDEGDDTCHENTLCGSTIYCQDIPNECAALPQCEADDAEVESCPTDASCYDVTECGATITCERAA
ncbi:hypothetical protein EA187_08985 [Lujinxingia sediminis]|uniref:Uncharacterized protein n=1 Tax=Lujinxingia sediminis TaxID=2480984 RepID=A0ABY0CVI3_9DELT|nr:hypothetical protein [Lujinxingia sediminis]RVU45881.1 hypothetical protein EA187_08985 [Lujinxingia sediminis]